MRKTSLDLIFLQAVLMMAVIVLLTVWIRSFKARGVIAPGPR